MEVHVGISWYLLYFYWVVLCQNRELMVVVTQEDTEKLWRCAFTGRPGAVGSAHFFRYLINPTNKAINHDMRIANPKQNRKLFQKFTLNTLLWGLEGLNDLVRGRTESVASWFWEVPYGSLTQGPTGVVSSDSFKSMRRRDTREPTRLATPRTNTNSTKPWKPQMFGEEIGGRHTTRKMVWGCLSQQGRTSFIAHKLPANHYLQTPFGCLFVGKKILPDPFNVSTSWPRSPYDCANNQIKEGIQNDWHVITMAAHIDLWFAKNVGKNHMNLQLYLWKDRRWTIPRTYPPKKMKMQNTNEPASNNIVCSSKPEVRRGPPR